MIHCRRSFRPQVLALLLWGAALPVAAFAQTRAENATLSRLPQTVTSFGAAISGGKVYIYGGHTGEAHSYALKDQDHFLRRLDLSRPDSAWQTLAEGPPLQGLALVEHAGKLYRIGGFTAKNAEGEAHDLWSQDSVACFDPDAGAWTEMPPLPEPRSSHDAAVVGDVIYVVGGWRLSGAESTTQWHNTAWAMDLSETRPVWKALPEPTFHRRAVALAAHQGKLFVIGGMQENRGPTRRTDIFDPQTKSWIQGPSLVGQDPMTGFGAAAFAAGGRLYVSTIHGDLQGLNTDGSQWELVRKLDTARFFHRMLPISSDQLLVIGGANMSAGKFDELETIDLKSLK